MQGVPSLLVSWVCLGRTSLTASQPSSQHTRRGVGLSVVKAQLEEVPICLSPPPGRALNLQACFNRMPLVGMV